MHRSTRTRRMRGITAALAAAGVAAVAVGLAPAAAAAPPPAQVETLPYAVDTSNQAAWWSPVDVFEGVTYFAYDAPGPSSWNHEVHLAARDAEGSWVDGCLRLASGSCATFLDDNGHNQPSVVVDGTGTIHAFVSMHHEQWNYFRSTVPGDVTSLVDATADMPDLDGTITYPVTARGPEGDAWVLVRSGAESQARREGVLYHLDPAVGLWERETVVGAARGTSFYPDDVEVDERGRVHLLWEWGPFPADPSRHLGSYVVYDPADGSFQDVAGATLAGPITPDTAGAVIWQPFTEGEELTTYAPALQSAKLAIRNNALEGIAYRFVPAGEGAYDIWHASWDGTGWVRTMLVDASSLGVGVTTIAAIDITSFGAKTRVYGVLGVPDCGVLRSQVIVLEQFAGSDAWTANLVGEDVTGQQRLRAAVDEDGNDVLYVSAPAAGPGSGTLSHVLVPRAGPAATDASLADAVADIGGDVIGENVALGADVTASSELRENTAATLAVDGVCADASRWISALDDLTPSITADWHEPTPLEVVRVRSGYSGGIPSQSVLRDFTVEVHTADGWIEIGRFDDNVDGTVLAAADGLVADQVRLHITDPSASSTDVARVYEIEAIRSGG
ncbi:BNR-4 repeat-containing protein [Agromyces sp. SYSU T00194]|uniref:BNR-4 repeat-containing protein n=1 Tax=Agromyces chitinivorans TaxID=3158560 RepID=UPI0033928FA1